MTNDIKSTLIAIAIGILLAILLGAWFDQGYKTVNCSTSPALAGCTHATTNGETR